MRVNTMNMSFNIDNDTVVIYPPSKLAEGLQFAKDKNIFSIRIQGNQHAIFDLDFNAFKIFPEIKRLVIYGNIKIGKVIPSDDFYHSQIQNIILYENFTFPLELHRLAHLTHLDIVETAKLKITKLPETLSWAKISKLSHDTLKVFADLPNLSQLDLISPKISSLSGIESCTNLECLFLFGANKLTDISSINQLNHLKRLEFERCKNLTQSDLALITSNSLQRLEVRFPVEDLSFLKNFPNLQEFCFTDVKDGNLNPILDSQIKMVGFSGKKHYSHRFDELSALLQEKWFNTNIK